MSKFSKLVTLPPLLYQPTINQQIQGVRKKVPLLIFCLLIQLKGVLFHAV